MESRLQTKLNCCILLLLERNFRKLNAVQTSKAIYITVIIIKTKTENGARYAKFQFLINDTKVEITMGH